MNRSIETLRPQLSPKALEENFVQAGLKKAQFCELTILENLLPACRHFGRVREELVVAKSSYYYPIYSIEFGPERADVPTFAIVGGVHGLERIGSRVALSFLQTMLSLMVWDETLQKLLESVKLAFYPITNPVGMARGTRSNGNGVDLMRNAPIEAETAPPWPLVGGHRVSAHLPWYRGGVDEPMQDEAVGLCRFVERLGQNAPVLVAVDLHSGFGMRDRIWFPYAKSKKPFEDAALACLLKERLDLAFPHNIYQIEPQSHQYTVNGDLWDFLYLQAREANPSGCFLPLTLEMGSWLWVKKNPRQLLRWEGVFNPMLPHRQGRALRRHFALFDFLLRMVASYRTWTSLDPHLAASYKYRADMLWYS